MSNRIEEVTNVNRVHETVAPQILIEWNPLDNSGYVSFCLRDMIWEDGNFVGYAAQKTLKNLGPGDAIRVPMHHIMEANIPVNGTTFSGQLLMGMIKAYYNMAWDEAKYLQDNPPVVPNDAPVDNGEDPIQLESPADNPDQLQLGL